MDATINWNLNSDELFRQMEQVNQKLLQMTRDTNTQQLLIMQESTNGMISVMDNYVQKIKQNFDIILDIMKSTWDLAKNENVRSFDEIKQNLNELTKIAKDSANEQLQTVIDSINKKIQAEENYVETVKSSTDRVITERKKEDQDEEERTRKRISSGIKSGISTATSGFTSMTGSETQTGMIDTGLSMIGKTIGAGVDIATIVEAGRGATSLFEVFAQGIGLLVNLSKRNDMMKQDLANIIATTGENIGDVYGTEYDVGAKGSTLNKIRTLETDYFGIKGFDRASMMQTMGGLGRTRLFGGEELFGMARKATFLGTGTGMQAQEVTEIFSQLRLKLNTPVDELAGRFMQLNDLSKDMGLSLRQVTNDIIQLSRDNQRYGFSLEQVMGLYKDFEVELKKGTVSASELSQYMKGMAETGTEKAVGIAALIASQDPNKVLANFTGNRAVGQEIAGLVSGAGPMDASAILRIINNPEADISNDPGLAPIAQRYGLTRDVRRRMNPEVERYIMAVAQTIAGESSGLGERNLIYEQFMGLGGLNLPTDLYSRSLMTRGLQGLGTTAGVMGLEQGRMEATNLIGTLEKELPKLTNSLERLNLSIETYFQNIVNDFITAQKQGPDAAQTFIKNLPRTLQQSTTAIMRELGFDDKTITEKLSGPMAHLEKLADIAINVGKIANSPLFGMEFNVGKDKFGKDVSITAPTPLDILLGTAFPAYRYYDIFQKFSKFLSR